MNKKTWETIFRIGRHLLFWSMVFLVYYISAIFQNYGEVFWLYGLALIPLDMAASYFTAYFLIPKLLLKRRYIEFFFGLTFVAVGIVLLNRWISFTFLYPLHFPNSLKVGLFFFPSLVSIAASTYTYIFLFAGTRLFRQWLIDQKRQNQLEKQNLNSELALLRSQINPHFLFNTLNNIDQLISKNQDKASESIVQLSEIMRYMLYEANTKLVPLEKELNYLTNYIELLKIRLQNPEFIQFEICGEATDLEIPPMLLVPFVENAYKHGKKYGEVPGIQASFKTLPDKYEFIIWNWVDSSQHIDQIGGIGLENIKRRLDLIYPNLYTLDIQQQADFFKAKLIIPHHPTESIFKNPKILAHKG